MKIYIYRCHFSNANFVFFPRHLYDLLRILVKSSLVIKSNCLHVFHDVVLFQRESDAQPRKCIGARERQNQA